LYRFRVKIANRWFNAKIACKPKNVFFFKFNIRCNIIILTIEPGRASEKNAGVILKDEYLIKPSNKIAKRLPN